MSSFLDDMASSIYAGFKGKLRPGVMRRLAGGTGLDGHGRPQDQTPVLDALEGFTDRYSAFTRAQYGIPLESLKLCIFGASLPEGVKPTKDAMVRLDLKSGPRWYKLKERIDVDPAGALWECEAQLSKAP